jgi:hypothetical protein
MCKVTAYLDFLWVFAESVTFHVAADPFCQTRSEIEIGKITAKDTIVNNNINSTCKFESNLCQHYVEKRGRVVYTFLRKSWKPAGLLKP